MNNIKIYAIIGQVIYQRGKKTEEVRYNVEYVINNFETALQIMEQEINKCNAIGYYGYHDWKVQIRDLNISENGHLSPFGELIKEVTKTIYDEKRKDV